MKNPKVIIDSDVTQISTRYAKLKAVTADKALELFLGSKTYKALIDTETGLCYEMTDYIYDMFVEEMEESR